MIMITGIDDHDRPESVITLHWIERSSSTGICDHDRPERALLQDAARELL
jgi:hypothetical protein